MIKGYKMVFEIELSEIHKRLYFEAYLRLMMSMRNCKGLSITHDEELETIFQLKCVSTDEVRPLMSKAPFFCDVFLG